MKLLMIIRGFQGSKRPSKGIWDFRRFFPWGPKGIGRQPKLSNGIKILDCIMFFSNALCVLVKFVGNFRGFVRLDPKNACPHVENEKESSLPSQNPPSQEKITKQNKKTNNQTNTARSTEMERLQSEGLLQRVSMGGTQTFKIPNPAKSRLGRCSWKVLKQAIFGEANDSFKMGGEKRFGRIVPSIRNSGMSVFFLNY